MVELEGGGGGASGPALSGLPAPVGVEGAAGGLRGMRGRLVVRCCGAVSGSGVSRVCVSVFFPPYSGEVVVPPERLLCAKKKKKKKSIVVIAAAWDVLPACFLFTPLRVCWGFLWSQRTGTSFHSVCLVSFLGLFCFFAFFLGGEVFFVKPELRCLVLEMGWRAP